MSLTLEKIDKTLENHPYWLLGKRLAYYLNEQNIIKLPTFPEQDRYYELNGKESSYEDSVEYGYEDEVDYPPLTVWEREEQRKLDLKHREYSYKIAEIHETFCQITKKGLNEFGVKLDMKTHINILTTSEDTLKQLKTIL